MAKFIELKDEKGEEYILNIDSISQAFLVGSTSESNKKYRITFIGQPNSIDLDSKNYDILKGFLIYKEPEPKML